MAQQQQVPEHLLGGRVMGSCCNRLLASAGLLAAVLALSRIHLLPCLARLNQCPATQLHACAC